MILLLMLRVLLTNSLSFKQLWISTQHNIIGMAETWCTSAVYDTELGSYTLRDIIYFVYNGHLMGFGGKVTYTLYPFSVLMNFTKNGWQLLIITSKWRRRSIYHSNKEFISWERSSTIMSFQTKCNFIKYLTVREQLFTFTNII